MKERKTTKRNVGGPGSGYRVGGGGGTTRNVWLAKVQRKIRGMTGGSEDGMERKV